MKKNKLRNLIVTAAIALPVVGYQIVRHVLIKAAQTWEERRTAGSIHHIPVKSAKPAPATKVTESPGPPPQQKPGIHTWPCPDEINAPYIASADRDKFHVPGCRWAQNIDPENRICFANREAALERDFTPCGTCKP